LNNILVCEQVKKLL